MVDFGYCTNVHPGRTLAEVMARLQEVSAPLQQRLNGNEPLLIGLWLNEKVVAELSSTAARDRFRGFLQELNLAPFTFNGFPQQDFHQPIVKYSVYQPTWAEATRLNYTRQLAEIQAALLRGTRSSGSISTLPLRWGAPPLSAEEWQACRGHLLAFTEFAEGLEARSGFHVRLALEAEPGCALGTSRELADFFDRWFTETSPTVVARLQRYLGVCHDVCHAAVQFEDQPQCLRRFGELKVPIVKIQVSSALVADFDVAGDDRESLRQSLQQFAEPRYLHQTHVDGMTFFDDLPEALARHPLEGQWRVHFHVPIFAEKFPGGLTTTQREIETCWEVLKDQSDTIDWEIETYAWGVLPEFAKPDHLVDGIEREFRWLRERIGSDRDN